MTETSRSSFRICISIHSLCQLSPEWAHFVEIEQFAHTRRKKTIFGPIASGLIDTAKPRFALSLKGPRAVTISSCLEIVYDSNCIGLMVEADGRFLLLFF